MHKLFVIDIHHWQFRRIYIELAKIKLSSATLILLILVINICFFIYTIGGGMKIILITEFLSLLNLKILILQKGVLKVLFHCIYLMIWIRKWKRNNMFFGLNLLINFGLIGFSNIGIHSEYRLLLMDIAHGRRLKLIVICHTDIKALLFIIKILLINPRLHLSSNLYVILVGAKFSFVFIVKNFFNTQFWVTGIMQAFQLALI